MTLPNFLIIGAAKSGTTALYRYLQQHPQIYMSPVKEPNFFTHVNNPPAFFGPGADEVRRRTVVQLADYQALFQDAGNKTAQGEASAVYLSNYHPDMTAENIRCHIPHVRLIAILRQPADRAYSYYNFARRDGVEPAPDFRQALAEEQTRIRAGWRPGCRYRLNGFYYANLKPYFERFKREQIRIYLYEDWLTQPRALLQDIFRFLQVDGSFLPDLTERYNVSYLPRSQAVRIFLQYPHTLKTILKPLLPQAVRRKLISKIQSLNQTKPPPLDPELRRQLTEEYREDILKLQDLIGRDLSHWLKPC